MQILQSMFPENNIKINKRTASSRKSLAVKFVFKVLFLLENLPRAAN